MVSIVLFLNIDNLMKASVAQKNYSLFTQCIDVIWKSSFREARVGGLPKV